jgi:pimeloyl-ACP methyl ester carboxylesterase
MNPRALNDSVIQLRDGRALAYCEWGDPAGVPVIYLHGLPGSRFECWGGPEQPARAGVRLITVDRPGIGRSDSQPGRRLSDWPQDIDELAQTLRLERFGIAGHSAGGAYALACMEGLGPRVAAGALIGCIPRIDQPAGLQQLATAQYWERARRHPSLLRVSYRQLAAGLRLAPKLAIRAFLREAAEVDIHALADDAARDRFRASVLEGMRRGPGGFVDDMRVLMCPWRLDASRIRCPMRLWHGDADLHVTPRCSHGYADELPSPTTTVVPDEGHFSLLERHAGEIFAELAHRASASAPV